MNSEGNLKKNSEVLVFFADGFEEIEAIGAVDILRRGGLDVATVSITDKKEVVIIAKIRIFSALKNCEDGKNCLILRRQRKINLKNNSI